MSFTAAEQEFLASQRLGRLATVDANGAPQNNPVGVHFHPKHDTIDIGGKDMGHTRKFHNVQGNAHVSLVIDELASIHPWTVRGIEIRGTAEALVNQAPPMPGMSHEIIRIHPERILSWGVDPDRPGMSARTLPH